MSKLKKMSRYVPGLYSPELNANVRGLLYAWSGEDDTLVSAIQDAKEQIYVKTAKLQFLDALGSNVGVFRPAAVNLADEQFRRLIPALSFQPKQMKRTIKKVLDVFYGEGNPNVFVAEVNPNEIVIQIPSSVPSLRRDLRGSIHFHNYSGVINSINHAQKEMTITLDGNTKFLKESELDGARIGQGLNSAIILDNGQGSANVRLYFPVSANLTKFQVGKRFVMSLPNYPGAYIADPRMSYSVTKQRGILGQNISAGTIVTTLTMQDASSIPDATGLLVFSMGTGNTEAEIKYFGRPNNTTLLLDPSYTFSFDHSIGEAVNVVVKPYSVPSIDGIDYSLYLVGITAARILAQDIIESVTAAGVVIRWVVVEPEC